MSFSIVSFWSYRAAANVSAIHDAPCGLRLSEDRLLRYLDREREIE